MPVQQQATAWVVGNVAYPPEQAGRGNSQRVRLRVLNNRGWYDRSKREWVDRPANGTEVICWGDLARNAAASIEVGDPVVVYGRLEENLWTDAEGASHRKTRVVADVIAHDLSRGQSRFRRIAIGEPSADPAVTAVTPDIADRAGADDTGVPGEASGSTADVGLPDGAGEAPDVELAEFRATDGTDAAGTAGAPEEPEMVAPY